jgi:hypothetical protein
MLASVGAIFVADAARAIGPRRVAAGIGFGWLFVAALLARYQQFSAIPKDVRASMARAGADTAPGTRFAVMTDDARLGAPTLDWFPTLSGRVSLGTYMGLEWTTVKQWDAAAALNDRIQQGEIPADAAFTFSVKGGSSSVRPAR